jgi:hypothetical protein
VLAIAFDYIVSPHVPNLLLVSGEMDLTKPKFADFVQISQNLTAYLAVITAAIAIYVAQYTIRAQVRSKSRQEWIDKVRILTATLISDVDRILTDRYVDMDRVNKDRLLLELLLNPSEKDHRLLTMLFRKCTHPNSNVGQDRFICEKLRNLEALPGNSGVLRDFLVNRRKIKPGTKDRDEVISYIIRLSNIILKREWMRVREAE